MRKPHIPKELRKLCTVLNDQDWSFEKSARGHIPFINPDGRTVYHTSGTPSDHRAWKNMLSALKCADLDVPAAFRIG